ncbi:thiol reductase thioredoxin [Bacillus cereus]|uniref:thioredoxin family protein n=1 Tax=Bacillus cereus TaxID=1396 RepID=UPI000BF6CBF8|nr:thioredoxin family protein [Bacillus cereus]PFA17482.1 thiol reductase thioredoxin [Bacillus cereus]PFR30175.1 thiol reductase thioredoxin [Bacillus cereus]PGZ13087.1 thiol reductase thioredoxin [Bacillus cereus]
MRKFQTIEELVAYIKAKDVVLLFIKTENCGVCDVMLQKVNHLLEQYQGIENIVISLQDMKKIAAEYLVFTGPTVLLFHEGKEILRESRFISLEKIERLLQLLEE